MICYRNLDEIIGSLLYLYISKILIFFLGLSLDIHFVAASMASKCYSNLLFMPSKGSHMNILYLIVQLS